MEFLQELSTFQWLLLGGGALLIFWPQVQALLNSNNKDEEEEDDRKEPQQDHEHDGRLTSIVCKWECLAEECHKAELHEACKKLNEVFPLFVKLHDNEHK